MVANCGVLLLAALMLPPLAYLCAKLAAYGWLQGRRKFYQDQEESDDGDEKRS